MKNIFYTSLMFVLMGGLLAITPAVQAEEEAFEVIAVKHSGWASRLNQDVKQTVKEGSLLYAGDILEVKHGNYVQLALDKEYKNIVHIAGNSVVKLERKDGVNIELNNGKVFAMLDNWDVRESFAISTPTAVSAVRGTYYMVNTNGLVTETTLYKGSVQMISRFANGSNSQNSVFLEPGQKSQIADFGASPQSPALITQSEFESINDIVKTLPDGRPVLNFQEILEAHEQIKNGDSDAKGPLAKNGKKDKKDRDGKVTFDNGNVVF